MKSSRFIVGCYNVEYLIQIPGTRWIIGSGIINNGPGISDKVILKDCLHVFDAETETLHRIESEDIAIWADLAAYQGSSTLTHKKITGKKVISQKLIYRMFATRVTKVLFDPSAVGPAAPVDCGNQAVSGSNSQYDFMFENRAFTKLGHNNQGLYINPAREFVGVYFSASLTSNYAIGYLRAAALTLDK